MITIITMMMMMMTTVAWTQLSRLASDGFRLVIFSNQAGIGKQLAGKRAEVTKQRIERFLQSAGVEMEVCKERAVAIAIANSSRGWIASRCLFQVYCATQKPPNDPFQYRKPGIGMWKEMLKSVRLSMSNSQLFIFAFVLWLVFCLVIRTSLKGCSVDPRRCLFVGDAAGRDKDFSDTDKLFAEAIGMEFKVRQESR